MRWIAAVAALMFVFSSAPYAALASSKNTYADMMRPGDDIAIKNVRVVTPTANGSGLGGSVWYIVTLTFTNSTAYPMIPDPRKFAFQGPQGGVYAAINGDPDLVGISNPNLNQVLKPGATFEYTVGFLIGTGQSGFIYYDRT
jgi:hypothetical protein